MRLKILIIAVILGAIVGFMTGDGKAEDALSGAMAGGCMAGNCLMRLLLAGLSILVILWLFNSVFG